MTSSTTKTTSRQSVGKLLLFGATGDLAQRMLLPSLFGLHYDGLLPEGLTITGTARSDYNDKSYREFAAKALDEFLPKELKDKAKIKAFLDRLSYQALDITHPEGFPNLAKKIGDTSGGLAPVSGIDKAWLRQWLRWLETTGPRVGDSHRAIPALAAINLIAAQMFRQY